MNLYYELLDKTVIVNKVAASHDFQTNNRSSCSDVPVKTPKVESLFNKVAGPLACNFIKKRL